MSELPFDQVVTALGNWSQGIPDRRARDPEALATRVLDALTLATQRAEAAEAERESVSSQLWDCMNERDALRAEWANVMGDIRAALTAALAVQP